MLEIRIRVVVVEVVERPGRSQLSGPFSGTGSDPACSTCQLNCRCSVDLLQGRSIAIFLLRRIAILLVWIDHLNDDNLPAFPAGLVGISS